MNRTLCVLLSPALVLASGAVGQASVNSSSLDLPQAGSMLGTYAAADFGPTGLVRGAFTLPSVYEVPEDRGPLLAPIFPTYSPENGMSEWGVGWAAPLNIARLGTRAGLPKRPCFCDEDELTSPWGRLVPNAAHDGTYYPAGLQTRVRIVRHDSTFAATMPDGSTWTFGGAIRVDVRDKGTSAWYLTSIETTTNRRVDLAYEKGEGLWFIKQADYGGVGEHEYRISFRHANSIAPRSSYQSGSLSVLDRTVDQITIAARNTATGAFTARWNYDIQYRGGDGRGKIYPSTVTRTFASGLADPPVSYAYNEASVDLERGTFSSAPDATALSAQHPWIFGRGVGTITDFDDDGVLDVEVPSGQVGGIGLFTRYLKRDAGGGYASQVFDKLEGYNRSTNCRFPNVPRVTVELDPTQKQGKQIIGYGKSGTHWQLWFCLPVGFPYAQPPPHQNIGQSVVTGALSAEEAPQFVDLDGDRRPEVVYRTSKGQIVSMYNTSLLVNERFPSFNFDLPQPSNLSIAPRGILKFADMNGDGLIDVVQSDAIDGRYRVFNVYLNMGFSKTTGPVDHSGHFTEKREFKVADPISFELADVNGDGIADLVSGNTVAINSGTGFDPETIVDPRYDQVNPIDLIDRANSEVAVVSRDAVKSRPTARPGTGLLASTDDGRGSALRFTYAKSARMPWKGDRQTVLSRVDFDSAGEGSDSYSFAYGAPDLHSRGRYLIGFSAVTRSGARGTTTSTFLNRDDASGLLTREDERDLTGYREFPTWQVTKYEPFVFDGVAGVRPNFYQRGYTTKDHVDHSLDSAGVAYPADGLCPSLTRRLKGADARHTFDVAMTRAKVDNLSGALHCLTSATTITGTHADASWDFRETTASTFTPFGLIESTASVANDGVIFSRRLTYDENRNVHTIEEAGGGTTVVDYDSRTHALPTRVRQPNGLVVTVAARDPVTDAILAISTRRGDTKTTQYFQFDGREQLEKTWDDFSAGNASASLPTVQLSYRDATRTTPASTMTETRLGPNVLRTTVVYRSAAGAAVANAMRIPEGWSFGTVTDRTHFLGSGEVSKLNRPSISESTRTSFSPQALEWSALNQGTKISRVTLTDAGIPFRSKEILGADGMAKETASTETTYGLVTTTENKANRVSRDYDVDGLTTRYTDAGGHAWTFGYDWLGRMRTATPPSGFATTVKYDAHGRVAEVRRSGPLTGFGGGNIPGSGEGTIRYAYRSDTGLLQRKTYMRPDGQVEREEVTGYDSIGRRSSLTYSSPSKGSDVYRYTYDGRSNSGIAASDGELGFLTAVTGPRYKRTMRHRADGMLVKSCVSFGSWRRWCEEFRYFDDRSLREMRATLFDGRNALLESHLTKISLDAYGREESVQRDGELDRIIFDSEGRPSSAVMGSDQLGFTRDELTRRRTGWTLLSGSQPARTYTYTSHLGNRGLIDHEEVQIAGTSLVQDYTYTPERYLGLVRYGSGEREEYAYTDDGVFLSEKDVPAKVPPLHAYDYDSLGRVTSRDGVTFTYGANGQIAKAAGRGGIWHYYYDEAGNRVFKTSGKADRPLAGFLAGGYIDAAGTARVEKVLGIVVGTVLSSGTRLRFATDARGTVLSDARGSRNIPSPWGRRTSQTESAAAISYVEKGYDGDLGLVRMGQRDYDPDLHGFAQPDGLFQQDPAAIVGRPLEGNLYSYAGNDPINFGDPSGLARKINYSPFDAGGEGIDGNGLGAGSPGIWGPIPPGLVLPPQVGAPIRVDGTGQSRSSSQAGSSSSQGPDSFQLRLDPGLMASVLATLWANGPAGYNDDLSHYASQVDSQDLAALAGQAGVLLANNSICPAVPALVDPVRTLRETTPAEAARQMALGEAFANTLVIGEIPDVYSPGELALSDSHTFVGSKRSYESQLSVATFQLQVGYLDAQVFALIGEFGMPSETALGITEGLNNAALFNAARLWFPRRR